MLSLALAIPLLAARQSPAQAARQTPAFEDFHATRIIVKYATPGKSANKEAALRQQKLKIHRQFKLLPRTVVLDLEDEREARAAKALPPQARAKGLRDRIAALRASGLYEYVEPDYIRRLNLEPTDTAYTNGTLWALNNFGQNGGTNGADIGAVAAWTLTTGSTNVIVAIVDTGIRYTHQDLAFNMWRNPGEIPDNGIDDDGDGYIDNVFGINAITGSGDPMDDDGHGSHVAGTIGAAANNGSPHVGVAWNVRLMACKALDSAGGSANQEAYVSDTTECIAFAVAKGARVINASYGAPAYSQTEFDAIRAARDHGVLFVAAAGNNRNGGQDNDSSWLRSYPASHALENVIAVAAVDRLDNLAWFSHFGSGSVHLGAPGVDIYSCMNGSDSAYGSLNGTSMASPHVAGAAALVLSRHPGASLVELRRRLLNGVVPIPSLTNKTATGGRLNVYNSLLATATTNLSLEVFPRNGQSLAAGKALTLSAIVSDLLPVTNATMLARITGLTNLSLLDNGSAPDAVAGDGIYTASLVVPGALASLEISCEASAAGWQDVTISAAYPVVFPPANDNFANRIAIPAGPCPVSVTASNANASREAGEPYHATGLGGHSVWWSWTAPLSGPVKLTTAESWVITTLAVYTGSVVSNLTLIASNDHPSYYDWYSALTFNAEAGVQYQIAVDGIGPDAGQLVLQVKPIVSTVPLREALDDPGLIWNTGGDAPWFSESCTTRDGADAAQSGATEANGVNWVETTVNGPGWFSFWWKISSEANWDFLHFSLDGLEQKSITGQTDWQPDRRWLEVGPHTLRWTYTKDFVDLDPKGQDAGWVDEVSFAKVNSAIPTAMGDLDGDGQPTVLDLTLLTSYLQDTNALLPQVAVFADVNRDGAINADDLAALANAILDRTNLLAALDADADSIPDVLEPLMGLDPAKKDSLDDGTADGDRDSDMDGLSNARELAVGTDPLRADSDGDGWSDEAELTGLSSPLDAASKPFLMVVSSPPVALAVPANEGAGGLALNTIVAQPPLSIVLPADEGAGGLALNTTVAQPQISVVLPANEGDGGLALNTTVAMPPVALVAPADLGPEELTNNTFVAMPPVALVLPWDTGSGGLTNNTVVAMPPVSAVLPWDQGAAGMTNNTVIAQPPVTIKIEP